MKLYLTVFLVSVLFALLADACRRGVDVSRAQGPLAASRRYLSTLRGMRAACVALSAAALVALSALRYDTGIDYMYSYVPSLETVRAGDASHYDPVFNFVVSIFARFENNQWFFVGTSIYIISMVYIAFLMDSQYIAIPVALFFASFHYLRTFSFVAQYVAMATLLVAFMLLLKRRYGWALALAALGVLLHKSMVVVLPFFLCVFLNPAVSFAASVGLPLFALAGAGIVRRVVELVSAGTRFDYYISGEFDVGYRDPSLIAINLAVFVLYAAVCLAIGPEGRRDRRTAMYLLAQSCALSFSLLQSVIPVGYRFVWFFMLVQCVSIPHMLRQVCAGSLYYAANGVITAAFYAWMVLVPVRGNASQVLPYTFVFDPANPIW